MLRITSQILEPIPRSDGVPSRAILSWEHRVLGDAVFKTSSTHLVSGYMGKGCARARKFHYRHTTHKMAALSSVYTEISCILLKHPIECRSVTNAQGATACCELRLGIWRECGRGKKENKHTISEVSLQGPWPIRFTAATRKK